VRRHAPALAPFYLILGSAAAFWRARNRGYASHCPRFEFEAFARPMERHRVRSPLLTPPIMKMLAQRPEVERHNLSALRLVASGGPHVPAEIEEAWPGRIGTTVVQGYGMTETSATIAITRPRRPRAGTCGKPFPLVKLRIVDPETATDTDRRRQ